MDEAKKSDVEVRQEEEALKNQCYQFLDNEKNRLQKNAADLSWQISYGAYDAHHEHAVYGESAHADRQLMSFSTLYSRLERTPYFGHIRVVTQEGQEIEDYLLADGTIDSLEIISDSCTLVPFMLDKERPMISALYECYQTQNGKPFTVKNYSYIPEAIRKVDIINRVLKGIMRLYPIEGASGATSYDADEYLAELILQSSGNADLQSIIATLQSQQFDIIKQDNAISFVVQGCAGSGKTQILIHRLYYLRTYLSQSGWESVRLITPNHFFKAQSADLFNKFNLGGVSISSLAEMYVELLKEIDPRFKERHYAFELTEEYLPDEYLSFIYSPSRVDEVKQAVTSAIKDRLQEACQLLGCGTIVPKDFLRYRDELIKGLQKLIAEFDAREKALENDEHFIALRKSVREYERHIEQQKQMIERREKALSDNYTKRTEYQTAKNEADLARNDITEWRALHADESKEAHDKLTTLESQGVASDSIEMSVKALFAVLHQRQAIADMTRSQAAQIDELLVYQQEANNKVTTIIGETNETRWVTQLDRSIDSTQRELDTIRDQLNENESKLNEAITQLAQYQSEDLSEQRKEYRSSLTKALSSIQALESNIFEEEIWNLLEPKKEEYGIETIRINNLDNGHHTETRVLYKFDLLFYLIIYTQLHPQMAIPKVSLFCIDEAQDLHKADYDLLHLLYPKAVYNIFGDTQQVVHESAGIVNWQKETGIDNVFALRKNYRNPASITQMCQIQFQADMDPLGKPNAKMNRETIQQITTSDLSKCLESNPIVILRDKKEYERFISFLPANQQRRCQYVDTKTVSLKDGSIPCYSVFAAKGLEFAQVLVYGHNMTRNQKIVSCTRAMKKLFYCEVDNHE